MKLEKRIVMNSEDSITRQIYLIRGHRVMLDSEIAELYKVSTKVLNQAVRRNPRRFPSDFMFVLTSEEFESLRSQIVTLKQPRRGSHRKYLPMVFTEQGVATLSGLLRSQRAIDVNIAIMRAFVKMRRMLSENRELSHKLAELENKLIGHDGQIAEIVQAIRVLMLPAEKTVPKIGYKP